MGKRQTFAAGPFRRRPQLLNDVRKARVI